MIRASCNESEVGTGRDTGILEGLEPDFVGDDPSAIYHSRRPDPGAMISDGEIRYVQIPATDVEAAARFYEDVFGWRIRTRTDGEHAFDDPSGHVSGTWVLGRTPAREPGVLVWMMVDDVEVTLAKITRAGGEVVSPMTPQGARRGPTGHSRRPSWLSHD